MVPFPRIYIAVYESGWKLLRMYLEYSVKEDVYWKYWKLIRRDGSRWK